MKCRHLEKILDPCLDETELRLQTTRFGSSSRDDTSVPFDIDFFGFKILIIFDKSWSDALTTTIGTKH